VTSPSFLQTNSFQHNSLAQLCKSSDFVDFVCTQGEKLRREVDAMFAINHLLWVTGALFVEWTRRYCHSVLLSVDRLIFKGRGVAMTSDYRSLNRRETLILLIDSKTRRIRAWVVFIKYKTINELNKCSAVITVGRSHASREWNKWDEARCLQLYGVLFTCAISLTGTVSVHVDW